MTSSIPSSSPIEWIEISNTSGLRVVLLSYGATLVSVYFPDKNGKEHDIVRGYDTIEGYEEDKYMMGKTIGRTSGRLKDGQIQLYDESERIQLEKNHGGHQIHGGSFSIAKKNWEVDSRSNTSVTFIVKQKHEEDGYPGDATIKCTYTVNDLNQLIIEHFAETTEPSPIALTNHAYWNLDEDSERIHDHHLYVRASRRLRLDDQLVPTGEFRPVEGTPFNFLRMRRIGPDPERINPDALQIDEDLILDDHKKADILLALESPSSGIRMTITSTYPSIHIYTAHNLDGSQIGKKGRPLGKYTGLAIEPQHYTCAAYFPDFPSVLTTKDKPSKEEIVYSFLHIQSSDLHSL